MAVGEGDTFGFIAKRMCGQANFQPKLTNFHYIHQLVWSNRMEWWWVSKDCNISVSLTLECCQPMERVQLSEHKNFCHILVLEE